MTTDLKDALNDLAGDEVRGLHVDVAAARAGARRAVRPVIVRTTLWASVAAVLLVAAPVLLIFTMLRPVPEPSTPQPGRDQWVWLPANGVRPLTAGTMPAASMVLGMPVRLGAEGDEVGSFPPHSLGRPPVLVSADGATYASLPWPKGSELLTLSRDGERLAWVSRAETGGRSTTTVYWLEVSEAVLHRQVLPAETADEWPTQVAFADVHGDGVLIGTRPANNTSDPRNEHLWRWSPGSSGPVRKACTCRATALGLDPDGTLWQGTATGRTPIPGVERSPVRAGTPTTSTRGWEGDAVSERLLVDAEGRVIELSEGAAGTHLVTQDGRTRDSVPVTGLGTGIQFVWAFDRRADGVLAWVMHGDQLRLSHRDAQLVLIDPETGVARELSHGDGRAVPLAVGALDT